MFSTIIDMVGLESAILFCVFYFLHVVSVLLLFLESRTGSSTEVPCEEAPSSPEGKTRKG